MAFHKFLHYNYGHDKIVNISPFALTPCNIRPTCISRFGISASGIAIDLNTMVLRLGLVELNVHMRSESGRWLIVGL